MAKVVYKRVQTNSEIDNIPVLDGQLIYSGEGKSYIDYGTTRVPINGTPDNSMSSSSTNPVENHVIKEYVDTQITNVSNNIHNGTILWTNQNPTASFPQQNITLAQNDCDMLLWIFKRHTGAEYLVSTIIIKEYGMLITSLDSSGQTVRRAGEYLGSDIYDIKEGTIGASTTGNDWLIPLYVIGYKTGLFE